MLSFQGLTHSRAGRSEIRTKIVANIGLYTCGLATLGTLLRVKCIRQAAGCDLRRLFSRKWEETRCVLLNRLLHYQQAYGAGGWADRSRAVLLNNLDGLVLHPGDALTHHKLDGLNLRGAILRNVNFFGSEWSDADVSEADLSGAIFTHCFLLFKSVKKARFERGKFMDAIIAQDVESELDGADFSGAEFTGAEFRIGSIHRSTFAGNVWENASVTPRRTEGTECPPCLLECAVDRAARAFFRRQGVRLRRCMLLD